MMIERSKDYFDAYSDNCDGIYAAGSSIDDVKADAEKAIRLLKENLPESQKYSIEVADKDKAYLPINTQTSYFIGDDSLSSVDFVFNCDKSGGEIAFWAKGRDVVIEMNENGFEQTNFDGGVLFYGTPSSKNFAATVHDSMGDYITVGSTYINKDRKIDYYFPSFTHIS